MLRQLTQIMTNKVFITDNSTYIINTNKKDYISPKITLQIKKNSY